MEIVKETEEYQIIKKRNGRYGVRRADRKWVAGDEKLKILIAEGLVKAPTPKPAPVEETADEPETSETPGTEADAEAVAESE